MKEQKIYSKKEALNIIVNAAKIYHDNLEDKDLLIIFKCGKDLKSYEVGFLDSNFQHFTGTEPKMSPKDFYDAALNSRLSVQDIHFKNNLLTSKKLDILENAMKLSKSAKMVGYYNGPKVELKADVGAGDMQYVMTFRYEKNKGDDWLHPVGIQKEDVRDVTTRSPIVAILRKDSRASIYNELTYKSKNINMEKLHIPKDLKDKIDSNILQQIKP